MNLKIAAYSFSIVEHRIFWRSAYFALPSCSSFFDTQRRQEGSVPVRKGPECMWRATIGSLQRIQLRAAKRATGRWSRNAVALQLWEATT